MNRSTYMRTSIIQKTVKGYSDVELQKSISNAKQRIKESEKMHKERVKHAVKQSEKQLKDSSEYSIKFLPLAKEELARRGKKRKKK